VIKVIFGSILSVLGFWKRVVRKMSKQFSARAMENLHCEIINTTSNELNQHNNGEEEVIINGKIFDALGSGSD